MITMIGIIAGEIWHYLDKHGRSSNIKDLLKALDKDRDAVLMSVGWLAREGHLVVEGEKPNYSISLRK